MCQLRRNNWFHDTATMKPVQTKVDCRNESFALESCREVLGDMYAYKAEESEYGGQ